MSLIESAIAANRKTAEHHDPSLANKPAPKVAILTCMDPRMNDLLKWLDIKPADADVIRNVATAATSQRRNVATSRRQQRQQRQMLCGLSCFRFTFWACQRSWSSGTLAAEWKCSRRRNSRTTSTHNAAYGQLPPINFTSIPM